MTGVDDMSTQDIFGYFKEYPPAHIEWIDDASCKCVTQTQTHAHTHGINLIPVSPVLVVTLRGLRLCVL